MKIDFHTHAFDDSIAQKAIAKLSAVSGYTPYTDGTIGGLKKLMEEDGIDRAVFLPIATKPSQQKVINDISAKQNSYELICFGSVHPDAQDALLELERIKALGLKGVKLHPDYQGFMVDDEKMFPIYSKCAELGLIVVFHAGYDPLSPELIHCPPAASAKVARQFPKMKMVLAHLGGMNMFEDVYEHIAGLENVWLDTAFLYEHISDEFLTNIIKKHSAKRILMASDIPWQRPGDSVKQIEALDLTSEEKEYIFFKSALELLGE